MVRKLMLVMLVSGIMCLTGLTPLFAQQVWMSPQDYEEATGNKIEKFSEAPEFRTKVAAGELPPVEERLPEEPLVVKPWEKIGTYGGTIRVGTTISTMGIEQGALKIAGLFRQNLDGSDFFPDVAKSYSFSDDLKTLTVTLRKGHKWSDGQPFTVDDVMFWWEDVLLNEELTPVIPTRFRPGGELAKLSKVNDYTFQLEYAVPYPRIMDQWRRSAYSTYNGIFLPKHYLKKWHIKYNPKANELAKEEGFEKWTQAFRSHRPDHIWIWMVDTEFPVLGAYKTLSVGPERKILVANPYYHMVDTAGNQLPYIERVESTFVGDQQVYNMKVINGEIDLAAFNLLLKDYPLFKKNEVAGNYKAELAILLRGAVAAFGLNQTNKDLVLRKIFQDIRFRRALSLGIDREEINELLFFGKGIPRQATILPEVSFYKEGWAESYAQYDPEESNMLLDEMGLEWDKNHEYRLRPDGKPILFTIIAPYGEGPRVEIAELVSTYWLNLGVRTVVKSMTESDEQMLIRANDQDCAVTHLDRVEEGFGTRGDPYWQSPHSSQFFVNWPWKMWLTTDGEQGEEPPERWKEWMRNWDEWFTTEMGTEEYIRLGRKVYDFISEELFAIGTVGMSPYVVVHNADLRNMPPQLYWTSDTDFELAWIPQQFFFEK